MGLKELLLNIPTKIGNVTDWNSNDGCDVEHSYWTHIEKQLQTLNSKV